MYSGQLGTGQEPIDKTMKSKIISILALFIFTMASSASADSLDTRGAYTITGYIFDMGTSLQSNAGQARPQLLPGAMDRISGAEFNGTQTRPPRSFALGAAFSATDKLTLLSTIGIAQHSDEPFIYNSNFGWEIDLGVAYKLLNNLTYEVHFGYMDTGEAFKDSPTLTEVEEITILTNKLTMSF